MTTPFQPTLPAETPLTEPELNYIEESPKGLYPENQDSNYGLLRRIFTTRITELIGQQATIYNERFVDTASEFMDEWEKEMGLPSAPTGATLATRRQIVKNRIIKSPFTKARRQAIVENFIIATFGDPVAFSPSGVALTSAGVPLYAESAPLSTLYSIRENMPYGINRLDNGNFESDIAGWGAGLLTGLAQSSAQSKFGTKSITGVASSTSSWVYAPTVAVTPGVSYTISAYMKVPRNSSIVAIFQWLDGGGNPIGANDAGDEIGYATSDGFKKVEASSPAPAGAASVRPIFQWNGLIVGDVVFLDGAQVEITPDAAQSKNLLLGSSFDTTRGTTFWNLIGAATLTNDGSLAHEGNNSGLLTLPNGSAYIANFYPRISGQTAGRKFTLSGWVYASGASVGKTIRIQINEGGGAQVEEGVINADIVLTSGPTVGWQRITVTGTIARNDRTQLYAYIFNITGTSIVVNIDSLQLEEGSVATSYTWPLRASSFVDRAKTPFYYEVRIKNTISPDMVGLVRELKRITPSGITFDVNQVADI